jgi:hypothetical protein
MGRLQRSLVRVVPGHADLRLERLAGAAAAAERRDDLAQLVRRHAHGDEAIGPPADPLGRFRSERRAHHLGGAGRSRVQLRLFHDNAAAMCDRFSRPERAHDVRALTQPGIAFFLDRPALTRDVFVDRLAAADREPETIAVHLERE